MLRKQSGSEQKHLLNIFFPRLTFVPKFFLSKFWAYLQYPLNNVYM